MWAQGGENSLLQRVLSFLAEPIYIAQRKMMARIRITGEMMDEFAGNSLKAYSDPQSSYPTGTMARMPTIKERIALAVTQAQDRLAQVREAQEIFERNPDLEKLLNIMQKNHF